MPILTVSSSPIWAVWEIEESPGELLEMLDKKELYTSFLEQHYAISRQQEWLAARVLLKKMLGEEKKIEYLPSGKPYLADNSYHIGISHTKNYLAIILAPKEEVSIDIEHISPRVSKIKERFLAPQEMAAIYSSKENIHLLLHWSAKETVFKILNKKEVSFKEHIFVHPFEPTTDGYGLFKVTEKKTKKKISFEVNYVVNSKYLLTFTKLQE
ncbi:siderophore biosynthesis protein [Bacteroidales bacterium]|nr:siderophore biosynthesis protein [Bacteroidales bacterium]